MTYAILYVENGDVVADFGSEAEARAELSDFVAEHAGLGDRVGILAFDEQGRPVGEFQSANQLEAQPA